MPRPLNRLTARTVTTLKEPGRHADGAGLYLHVDPEGSKRWVFVFQWQGRRKEMGLGPIHDVSLAEAREARDKARKLVRDAINPIEERRRQKAGRAPTFGAAAEEMITSLEPQWRNVKQASQWRSSLKSYAGRLTDKPVNQILTADVLAVLKPIWSTKHETARRVRGRIEAVLDAAGAKGFRDGPNPARLKGHLDKLLPRVSKLQRGHHKAMPVAEIQGFMRDLRSRDAMAARALELVILTAARSGEVRLAPWREFDLKAGLWTVPKERMKAGREHRVPLQARAVALLQSLWLEDMKPGDYVFQGLKPGSPISNMTMDKLLRRMDLDYTVHGFRSTFRDWAGDHTEFARELAEAALAHSVGDEAEKAYRRGDALEKRRKLMDAWADFLGGA